MESKDLQEPKEHQHPAEMKFIDAANSGQEIEVKYGKWSHCYVLEKKSHWGYVSNFIVLVFTSICFSYIAKIQLEWQNNFNKLLKNRNIGFKCLKLYKELTLFSLAPLEEYLNCDFHRI